VDKAFLCSSPFYLQCQLLSSVISFLHISSRRCIWKECLHVCIDLPWLLMLTSLGLCSEWDSLCFLFCLTYGMGPSRPLEAYSIIPASLHVLFHYCEWPGQKNCPFSACALLSPWHVPIPMSRDVWPRSWAEMSGVSSPQDAVDALSLEGFKVRLDWALSTFWSCRCPWSLQGSWSSWPLKVPSNSNNSVIVCENWSWIPVLREQILGCLSTQVSM